MYLKEVDLENFKSFGKKKRIPILRGFTVVTGPNGSGKSNIGDAVLFVLGPKSSKAIRAGKLTNLIYNGGKKKSPAKFCRVSLVFDNVDRVIPLENDEVTFTRFVKLSPSDPENYLSYFYVNGRKSSLSEFDDLLSHAHISAEGYNLVKQGDVTRIVEMGNVERRRVLDDVSGVTKYDEGIKKAEEKRAGVEENLDRIGIIIDEIKRQIKMLEKERGAALKYKELKDTYDLAKAQSAYKRKEMIQSEMLAIDKQIENYNSKEKEFELKIGEQKEHLNKLSKELDEMEEKIEAEGGEEASQLKKKIDDLRIEIARTGDGQDTSRDALASLKEDKKIFASDLRKLDKVLENLREQKLNCESELTKKREELNKKEKEHEDTQKAVGKSDSEALSIQKSIHDVNKSIETKEDELRGIRIEEDRTRERMERLRGELADLEEANRTMEFEIKDVEFQLKDMSKNAKETGKSLQALQEAMEDKRKEEEKLHKEAQELEAAITRLNREYNRLKAEAEAAESIRRGYNMAVNAVLEARDCGKLKGIHGTVAELANVDERFEVALSVAAGARMQSIVVDNDECASKAIEFLKKKKIGRATFLPLNKMSEGRPRGKALMASRNQKSMGFALDLVDFEPQYKAAFWYVLGDTLVVENLKTARELMGGIRLVTLEGELLEAAGAMIGGRLATRHLKFGAPTKKDIEKVGSELRDAIKHADSLAETLQGIRGDIIQLEGEIREHGGHDDVSSYKIKDLKSKRTEFKKKLSQIQDNLKTKESEEKGAQELLAQLSDKIKIIDGEIGDLKNQREKMREALVKATPQEFARQVKRIQKKVYELTNQVAKLDSSSATMKSQIEIHEERHAEIEGHIESINEEMKGHKKNIKDCTQKENTLKNELEALQKVEASMNQEMKKLSKKRDDIYRQKTDCETAIDKIITKVETNRDFVIGLRTKAKTVEENLRDVERELEELSIQIEADEKLPSLSELKDTVASCERRMRNLEPINMKAIDDYDEQEKRLSELVNEVKHLKNQRRNLLAVVKELDKKKKIEFTKVFERINENFKKIFAELSYGGEAELLLENPESPFEGGLIIKARPRGKKILRLESLSGGEKSLTALGLIFAIQHHAPSPFYLLDEVDMFLDAVNAERVARMVKKNSKRAQFVMVSLRKVTLKEADTIYGVTMRADSISDVVGNVSISDLSEEIPALAADGDGVSEMMNEDDTPFENPDLQITGEEIQDTGGMN